MDAHIGTQEEQFVVEMAVDGTEWFMRFVVMGLLVGIVFLPLFAYGLAVTVWDFVKVRYSFVREYVTKLSTKSRYVGQVGRANS